MSGALLPVLKDMNFGTCRVMEMEGGGHSRDPPARQRQHQHQHLHQHLHLHQQSRRLPGVLCCSARGDAARTGASREQLLSLHPITLCLIIPQVCVMTEINYLAG